MLAKTYSCVGGQYILAHRAAIPVTDRGFRFGDGVFETIRLSHGVPYQWDLHLKRMLDGLAALQIPAPDTDWADAALRLMRKNKSADGFLRLAVSRGSGSRGYVPYPPAMPPTWIIEQLATLPGLKAPLTLWLSDLARVPLQCMPVNFKLAQGIGSTLAIMQARAQTCDDALQLTTSGLLCETASANIYWVADGTIYTPSLDTGCLNGTTRDAVMRVSPLPVKLTQAGIHTLQQAECVFISNSRLGIWPIATLQPMGWTWKTNHPVFRQLRDRLTRDVNDYARAHADRWRL